MFSVGIRTSSSAVCIGIRVAPLSIQEFWSVPGIAIGIGISIVLRFM